MDQHKPTKLLNQQITIADKLDQQEPVVLKIMFFLLLDRMDLLVHLDQHQTSTQL